MHVIKRSTKYFILIWLLVTPVAAFAVNVVWDLGNTLIRPSRMKTAQSIGMVNSLMFYLGHGPAASEIIRTTMFDVLSYGDSPQVDRYTPKGPTGIPMPIPMQQWLKGKLSSKELLNLALERSASYPDYVHDEDREMVESIFVPAPTTPLRVPDILDSPIRRR